MSETYGGYNMPGDEFFYLSSMYSDKLLTEFLPNVKNRAYQRYLQIQKDLLNGNELCGTLKQSTDPLINEFGKYYFKESIELCNEFNFPIGSIFADITAQGFYLDIADKYKFLKTFGSFYTPISYSDIISHPEIFNSMIHCRIGEYEFTKFYIIKDKYHRIYIGIKNSSDDGLTMESLKQSLSMGTDEVPVQFCIWKDDQTTMYTYDGNINSIISNSSNDEEKYITVQLSSTVNSVPLHEDNNWTIMISYHISKYGKYIYSTTDCYLVNKTNNTLTFGIPSNFLDDITSRNSIVSCVLIQRTNRAVIYEYDPTDDTEPWLALGSYDKPVSVANIKIYEYDKLTSRYLQRLPMCVNNFNNEFNDKVKKYNYNESNYSSDVIFPSIYKFPSGITLRIELLEYNYEDMKTKFDNHIKCLFQYPNTLVDDLTKEADYSAERYLEYLSWLNENKEDPQYGTIITEVLNKLINFNPMNIYMDYDDYLKSGLHIRQYKFGKLMELISSDPYIYADYIKFMDKMNFNIIKECGSPNHFKLNTGLTDPDLCGSNQIVNDDSFIDPVNTYTFSEPHTYIKIHADNYDAFCLVFIGGRLITPTEIKSKLNDIYLFFPVNKVARYITSSINKYWNNDSLNKNNLISVDCYNHVNRSETNREYFTNIFESTSINYQLFDGDHNFKYHLSDLVIYNKTSGEYIPLSKFDITAEIKTAVVEFNGEDVDHISGSSEDLIYMGTHLGEFYMTKDNGTIILDDGYTDMEFPKDSLGDNDDNYSAFLNKEWPSDELKFTLNDPDLVGAEIEFVYSPVGYGWDIPLSQFTLTDDGNYVYNIEGFLGKNKLAYFELFIDGEYIDLAQYVTLPDNVNGKIVISIPSTVFDDLSQWYSNTIHTIQLRYNPTTYSTSNNNTSLCIPNRYDENMFDLSDFDINALSKPIFYYNIFSIDKYDTENLYLNSDCSKLFAYGYSFNTALYIPYKWTIESSTYDLQENLNILKAHSSLESNPVFKDIHEDLDFTYMSDTNIVKSMIDQLMYNISIIEPIPN